MVLGEDGAGAWSRLFHSAQGRRNREGFWIACVPSSFYPLLSCTPRGFCHITDDLHLLMSSTTLYEGAILQDADDDDNQKRSNTNTAVRYKKKPNNSYPYQSRCACKLFFYTAREIHEREPLHTRIRQGPSGDGDGQITFPCTCAVRRARASTAARPR